MRVFPYGTVNAPVRLLLAVAWLLATPVVLAEQAVENPPAQATATLAAGTFTAAVVHSNPGLAAMRSALEAASARIEPAGALPDPVISYGLAPNTVGDDALGTRQQLLVAQALPWPGTLDLQSDVATRQADSARASLEDYRLKLIAESRAEFADWYYVHWALRINARTSDLVRNLRGVARTAYASGGASQQDVLQAEVELTRLANQKLELERRRHSVQAAMNGLLATDPARSISPPADLPPTPALSSLVRLRSLALARSPRLAMLDSSIAAGEDKVALADKKSYPDFHLSAGYNGIMDPVAKRLVVGIAVSIPLDQSRRHAEQSGARADLRRATAERADMRARLLAAVEQAYAGAEQARQTLALYADQLIPLARQNMEAAEADYRSGKGDFLRLISAEREYLQAELEQARARAELYKQTAALDYHTGGAVFASSPDPAAQEIAP